MSGASASYRQRRRKFSTEQLCIEEAESLRLLGSTVDEKQHLISAGWCIEDAFFGMDRPNPIIVLNFIKRIYRIHGRLYIFRIFTLVLLLLLSFLEIPYWCDHPSSQWPCGEPEAATTPFMWYWQWHSDTERHLLLLSPVQSVYVELCCVGFLLVNLILHWSFMQANFWARKDRIALVGFCLVSYAELLYLASYFHQTQARNHPLRYINPYLRIALFVSSSRNTRKAFRKLLMILPEVQNIISLVVLFIFLSAWIGCLFFQQTPEATEFMPNIYEASWNLFILLTTVNFPDVMMPIYTQYRVSSIFFVVFLCFGLFFLMNIILAVIYNNYKQMLTLETERKIVSRRRKLLRAFDLLLEMQNTRAQAHTQYAAIEAPVHSVELERKTCILLFKELNYLKNIAYIRPAKMNEFFNLLNISTSGTLSRKEFCQLFHVWDVEPKRHPNLRQIATRVRKSISHHHEFEPCCPTFYRSNFFHRIAGIVHHPRFEMVIDLFLVLNIGLVFFESSVAITGTQLPTPPTGKPSPPSLLFTTSHIQTIEFLLSVVYCIEMGLKIVVDGWKKYWHRLKNRFDCVITVLCFLTDLYGLICLLSGGGYMVLQFHNGVIIMVQHTVILRLLLFIRFLRIFRLLSQIERYRVICSTATHLIPAAGSIFLMIGCTMYFYAALGSQLFGGRIYPANVALNNSTFAQSNYFANNFNDFPSATVTLFEMLVVNNWHIIAEGHVLVTTKWSRLFFLSFYVIGVVFLLNIVIAYTLDIFIMEWSAIDEKHRQNQEHEQDLELSDVEDNRE